MSGGEIVRLLLFVAGGAIGARYLARALARQRRWRDGAVTITPAMRALNSTVIVCFAIVLVLCPALIILTLITGHP